MTKSERKQASLTGSPEIGGSVAPHEEGSPPEEGIEYEKNNRLLGDWLDIGYSNEKTKSNYYTTILRFLKIIYPDENIFEKKKGYTANLNEAQRKEAVENKKNRIEYYLDKYVAEDRVFLDDFRICIRELIDQEYAPGSINTYMSKIKTFFDRLDEEKYGIPKKQFSDIRRSLMPPNVTSTQDEIPTQDELRKIIGYLPVMHRAINLFLVSTGVRRGVVPKLKVEALTLNADPPWINIAGSTTKAGVGGRKVWFTPETKEAIEAWLKILMYVDPKKGLRKKPGTGGEYDRSLLFDVSENAIKNAYNLALKKAGLDQRDPNTKNKVRIYHIHTLRKFFSTEMEDAGMSQQRVDALMGHSARGYLTEAYKRPRLLAESYAECMHAVTIFEKDLDTEILEEKKTLAEKVQGMTIQDDKIRRSLEMFGELMNIGDMTDLRTEDIIYTIEAKVKDLMKTLDANVEEIAYLKETGRVS